MTRTRSAIDLVCAQPWAILPDYLTAILAIAEDHAGTERALEAIARAHGITLEAARARASGHASPEALAERRGPRLAGTRTVTMRGGVAVLPVVGPIIPRANLLAEISGATSVELLGADLRAALDNPDVRAILLDVDSPGGVATGISELGRMVFAARGVKPIVAHADGLCASAAYWIGSQADELVVTSTAVVGSIGVATALRKQLEPDARGERTFEIVSSRAPNKRPDPSTEQGQAKVRELLDGLEAEFVNAAARARGMSAEELVEAGDHGGLRVGAAAVEAGLADRVAGFEETLARLNGTAAKPAAPGTADLSLPGGQAAYHAASPPWDSSPLKTTDHPAQPEKETAKMDSKTFAEKHPDEAAKLREEGATQAKAAADAAAAKAREEGRQAEAKRIADLEAAALPGYEKELAACKADPDKTAADLAQMIVAKQKAQGVTAQGEIAAAGALTAAAPPTAPHDPADAFAEADAGGPQVGEEHTEQREAEDRKRFDADSGLKRDFRTADAYVAFCKMTREGNLLVARDQNPRRPLG